MSQNNAQNDWRDGVSRPVEWELRAWYQRSEKDPTLEIRTTGAGSVTAILAEGTEAHIPPVLVQEDSGD